MAQSSSDHNQHAARMHHHRLRVHAAAAQIAQDAAQAVTDHNAKIEAEQPTSGPTGAGNEASHG